MSLQVHLAVLSVWLKYLPRCGVHQETSQNTAGLLRSVALKPTTLTRTKKNSCYRSIFLSNKHFTASAQTRPEFQY